GNNNNPGIRLKSNDGRTQALFTTSGSLTASGRLVIRLPTSHSPERATPPFSDYDIARFIGNNSGSFVDTLVQNAATMNATSDIVAQNSAASDSAGYIDMGYTSQVYNVAGGGAVGPSEGYLYTPSSNMN